MRAVTETLRAAALAVLAGGAVLLAPAAAACLYVAIDGLLATGPRLAALARLRRPEVRRA